MAISNWNPRPANASRRAYIAGYSDGFYGYRFGSGDWDHPNCVTEPETSDGGHGS